MNRETALTIIGAVIADSDSDLLVEATSLINARYRVLRSARAQSYYWLVGKEISYLAVDGKTEKTATLHHINRFSLTLNVGDGSRGYIPEVVPVERILTMPF